MVGAIVRLHQFQFRRGAREIVDVGHSDETNDLGEYRIYGLSPGQYLASASLRVPIDDVVGTPPAIQTFFPATAHAGVAQALTVQQSGTVSGIVISMLSSSTTEVRGQAVDVNGQPFTSGFVNVSAVGNAGSISVSSGRLQSNGTFSIAALPPGDYVARAQSVSGGAGTHPKVAAERITISGGERVIEAQLREYPWGSVVGEVRTATDPSTSPSLEGLRLQVLRNDPNDPLDGFWAGGTVDRDGNFQLNAPPGAIHVRPGRLPEGWVVAAVRFGEEGVTDRGFVLEPGSRARIELRVTNATGLIKGSAYTGDGEPVRDYAVVVFATDDSKWIWNSRHVHEALPDSEGVFSLDSLLRGDYYAVAVDALHRGQALNADFLKEVEGAATRIAVKAHETTLLSLPLTAVGPR